MKADILALVGDKADKYERLVWYARKHPVNHPSWCALSDEIRSGAFKAMAETERDYPEETSALNGDGGDWQHGFHSGALAAFRYALDASTDPVEAEAAFPDLTS